MARLYTDGVFDAKLRTMFEDGYRVDYHLGRLGGGRKKQSYGPWMKLVFRVMNGVKILRSPLLNPFYFTADRRRDRKLIRQYEAVIDEVLELLRADNLELAADIANVPDGIRGFGPIRDRSIITAWARHDQLIEKFNER